MAAPRFLAHNPYLSFVIRAATEFRTVGKHATTMGHSNTDRTHDPVGLCFKRASPLALLDFYLGFGKSFYRILAQQDHSHGVLRPLSPLFSVFPLLWDINASATKKKSSSTCV